MKIHIAVVFLSYSEGKSVKHKRTDAQNNSSVTLSPPQPSAGSAMHATAVLLYPLRNAICRECNACHSGVTLSPPQHVLKGVQCMPQQCYYIPSATRSKGSTMHGICNECQIVDSL